LDENNSLKEAEILIRNRDMWILRKGGVIVSILATARRVEESETIAITKVCTAHEHKRNGYAAVLVHGVCRRYVSLKSSFSELTMKNVRLLQKYLRVVLLVGTDNLPARNLYEGVGFQGLEGDKYRYLEIGFEDAELGFW
jgi:predicted GNAT family acetyltransferase